MNSPFTPAHPMAGSFLEEMVMVKNARTKRVSSWDRVGGNHDWIEVPPHATATLADIRGAGCIRHIYFTIGAWDRLFWRKMVLRMYWDNEKTPSVEVPIGDLFGLGFGEERLFTSLLVTVNPGAKANGTLGLNCYFPMPFSERAVFTLENDSDVRSGSVWYHIDYEEHDAIPQDYARFHAQWRRENPTHAVQLPQGLNIGGEDNYVILEAEGQGQLTGLILNIDNLRSGWYGEGDDMIFIDGDIWPPSLHGTGTEEIFGGGACPNQEYAGPYTGYHLISNDDFAGRQSMYRWFVNDPIRFKEKIKVTLEHGHANDLGNDYSSTACWYQLEPHGPFPALPSVENRIPRCSEGFLALCKAEKKSADILTRYGDKALDFVITIPVEEASALQGDRAAMDDAVRSGEYDEAIKCAQAMGELFEKYDRLYQEKDK